MLDLDSELEMPARRGRPLLRQPLAPTSEPLKRSGSWWMHSGPTGFTARAAEERDRMASDKEGRKVPDQIDGNYIGLLRPQQ